MNRSWSLPLPLHSIKPFSKLKSIINDPIVITYFCFCRVGNPSNAQSPCVRPKALGRGSAVMLARSARLIASGDRRMCEAWPRRGRIPCPRKTRRDNNACTIKCSSVGCALITKVYTDLHPRNDSTARKRKCPGGGGHRPERPRPYLTVEMVEYWQREPWAHAAHQARQDLQWHSLVLAST